MTDIPGPSDSPWRLWSWIAVVAALLFGGGLGIVVIPLVQGGSGGVDAFTAICRAIGVLPGSPARPTPSTQATAVPVTQVAWTDKTIGEITRADRNNGAKIAEQRCISCHTVEGNTPDPTIPRNAGQSRFAIYKQLHDYKSGARKNETMTPLVADLDDKAIADLAAYYGRLVRGAIDPERSALFVGADIENLVANGDIARNLPPCGACHGIRAGGPIETPTLTSQYAQYIEAQLKAFAGGERQNDIYHRMRSVASKLRPEEMHLLSIYYSGK
jgi:cytochrome c553